MVLSSIAPPGAARRWLSVASVPANAPSSDLLGKLFFGVLVTACCGLGLWQVGRYSWKADVVAARAAELALPPMAVEDGPSLEAALDVGPAFAGLPVAARRVVVSGTLDVARAVTVGPRPAPKGTPPRLVRGKGGNAGFLSVAPLMLDDGTTVMVLRGWWPLGEDARAGRGMPPLPPPPAPGGHDAASWVPVQLEGVLRASGEAGGPMMPLHTPDSVENGAGGAAFTWLDAPSIAAHLGLPVGTPLVEVILPPPDEGGASSYPYTRPLAGLAETAIPPATHATYALTWFTLAAIGGALAVARFRRGGRNALAGRRRR